MRPSDLCWEGRGGVTSKYSLKLALVPNVNIHSEYNEWAYGVIPFTMVLCNNIQGQNTLAYFAFFAL